MGWLIGTGVMYESSSISEIKIFCDKVYCLIPVGPSRVCSKSYTSHA